MTQPSYHYRFIKETTEHWERARRAKRIRRMGIGLAAIVLLASPSPLEALPASNVICQHTFFC